MPIRQETYSTKYLPTHLVESCFVPNKLTHVDKLICGNGFTTAFLTLKPSEEYKVNIIIVPNLAVIKSKEADYHARKIPTDNIVKFFHKDGRDKSFRNADVLFFVADSFIERKASLLEIRERIDKVLIDEYHSIQIQSSFRFKLNYFASQVREVCDYVETSVVTVTASPNLFSKIDVRFKPEKITPTLIQLEYDKEVSFQNIKRDLKNNENVVVFTNSAANVYFMRNGQSEVKANFIVGESFMRSLVEKVEVIPDAESNLTIVTSRGFEGFNIMYDDAKVYFFEDRSYKHETFYISNLYQAISRTRKGAKYIEYCRCNLAKQRKSPFDKIDFQVKKFIDSEKISVEAKQQTKFKEYRPFVSFIQLDDGKFEIRQNQAAVELYKETRFYDNIDYNDEFDEFMSDRGISFLKSRNPIKRVNSKIRVEKKIFNLLQNAPLITKLDLFGEEYILNPEQNIVPSARVTLTEAYLRDFNEFLRRKNYDGNYTISKRQRTALRLLSNNKEFNVLLEDLVKTYDIRSIKKYGEADSEKYRADFRNLAAKRLCQYCFMFSNKTITTPARWTAHRDYNLLTMIGIDEIKLLCNYFALIVEEVDIKTCFPRVLYALSDLPLPAHFYGSNKAKKIDRLVLFNNFFFDPKSPTTKKAQAQQAVRKFERLDIDDKVIAFLMSEFFQSEFRSDLFNFLSFHEKKLIGRIKEHFKEMQCSEGIIRRHDSLILFNNTAPIEFLNTLEYLGQIGWFKVVNKMQVTPESLFNQVDLFED